MQADHAVTKRRAKARPAALLDDPKGFRAALRNIWPSANRDEAQGKSPARSAPRCPKGFRAALRNIWPSANRDEAQSKSPARSAPRCSKGFRAALRNIWPSANRDEAQSKSPALSIIMYPFLFLQAALSALLYF